MNLVAGYKKLMEMYIALNIELVKVWLHGLACLVLVQYQNYVATRYYHSEFIGKASTKDVFNSFSACVSGVSESKLLQVSSDDPNVTGYFLTFLRKTGMIKY